MDQSTQDVLKQLVKALEAQLPVDKLPAVTVREAVEEFCLAKEAAGRSSRTVDTYRQRLGLFVDEYGHLIVGDVSPVIPSRFIAQMHQQQQRYEDHPRHSVKQGRLSLATVDGRIQALRAFFKWCVERGYCKESPAAHLQRQGYDPSQESRAMEVETLHRMIAAARGEASKSGTYRNLALLLFMADTGVRVGEAASLHLDNLDLGNLWADVDGKTGRRTVYFTQTTVEALRCWLEERPDCKHSYVFCSLGDRNFGRPITTNAIYITFRRLAKAAGVEDRRYNPHAVRHLVGQTFVEKGNLELARRKLGHKDVATTSRHYANQDAQRLKRATHRLSLVEGGMTGS